MATANTKQTVPWMFHINPSLSDAITTSNKDFNTEDLAAKQPDIFFMSPGNTNADKIKSMGIPTVQLNFTNYDEMKQCISLTAQVLGGDAITRADKYIQYLTTRSPPSSRKRPTSPRRKSRRCCTSSPSSR